ncbi:Gfo/Idh/MocA family oxidoreductase [Rhodovarius crocodyli]|uniref:Gfo/Idh/MocA family oxidoreductase n=1 Tax=Rhodovarius crocodyli TaxID=1979269 RepID=A0A437MIT6_9PROT|nr:Gfo/Idh/MocA family oxidoreductase [Rhodovarius crocodyli]RVT97552.1 Gfo/Idh/MocA family oxidoreductase [Rhodovarius crocodyli]
MAVALGIIGLGIMGERLLRAALNHDQAVIRPVAVWDPAPGAAEKLAGIAPNLPLMASAQAVIQACDALYVASPPSSHLEHAGAAFAAGRSVFLEKPLAADVAAARAFVTAHAAERAGVNFPMASSPAVAQLTAWRQELGAPKSLSIAVRFGKWPRGWQHGAAGWLAKRAEGGFTREVLSHFLFLTRRQLGALDLREHEATFPPGDGSELAISATLSAGGVPVSITGDVGQIAEDEFNEWRLECEGGTIRLRNWSIAERLGPDGFAPAPDALPNEKMRPMVLQGQLNKLAALTKGEAQNLATLREALEVQEVVERILG